GGVFDERLSEEMEMPVYSLDAIGEKIWPGQVRGAGTRLSSGKHRVRVVAAGLRLAAARWSGIVKGRKGRQVEEIPADSLLLRTAEGESRLELPNGTLHSGSHARLVSRGPNRVAILPEAETARPGARLIFRPADAERRRAGLYRIAPGGARRFAGGWTG